MTKGIRIRSYPSGKRAIVIAFTYRGVECRETLKADASLKSSLKYAENLRGAILDKIERGTFNYADYFPDSPKARLFGHALSTMTVKEAQQIVLDDLPREATTLESYTKSAKRINGYLGKHRLVDLMPEHFREMFRKRQVSRKTWNNDLIPLRKALKRAVMDGVINFNPLDRVDIDELVPKHEKPGPDPFTLAEITALLSAAGAENAYSVALYTGMRLEELAGLTWANVDFVNAKVYVTHAAQLSIRSKELKAPKTRTSARTIDLLPKALEALKSQQAQTRFQGDRVFMNGREPYTRYKQFRRNWTKTLEAAGVRYRAMKQCRHTYASHMLSSGHNPLYVASQLGHTGTALLDVYGRWVDDWKDEREVKYGT